MAVSPELKKEKARLEEQQEEGESADEHNEDDGVEGEEIQPPSKKTKLGKGHAKEESDASSRASAAGDEEEVDDAGWESGSIRDGPGAQSESEESEDEQDEDSVDEGNNKRSTSSKQDSKLSSTIKGTKAKPTQTKKVGESTFLPSLAVGFTRGDSDASDFSDDDDVGDVAPKKNRRGQRARQA